MRRGDWFTVEGELHKCTRQVVDSATASRRQLTLEFEPNLRQTIAAGTALLLDNPTPRMKIPPGGVAVFDSRKQVRAHGNPDGVFRPEVMTRVTLEEPEIPP